MITCNVMGGLGNQLFQIFTTISYAIQNKREFGFLYSDYVGIGKTIRRKTYWKTLLKYMQKYVYISLPGNMKYINEDNFHYHPLSISSELNICLFGYFQSYKYFEKYSNLIIHLLKIEELKKDILKKNEYNKENLETTVTMHFRLGDYKFISNAYPLLTFEYYDKCLTFLNKDDIKKVLYFCEEQDVEDVDIIINKLKTKYNLFDFVKVSNKLDDWEQLLLMSCCKYNIIANSTFSWWGAYLNTNESKKVCYPDKWFGPKKNHLNTKDLFLSTWCKISY